MNQAVNEVGLPELLDAGVHFGPDETVESQNASVHLR